MVKMRFKLHLKQNRAGQFHFPLIDIPRTLQADDAFYPVLGYFIGKLVREQIPVISGLEVNPTEDQLKALGAASASSGAVALFHIVNVTPEAPTIEEAFQNKPPVETIPVTKSGLAATRVELSTSSGSVLDMVILGSPHFSISEFKILIISKSCSFMENF